MIKSSSVPSLRKLAILVVGVGLVSGATPGAAVAGGGTQSKPTKCDPIVQVCGDGRKNG